ncbi:hypothetical protein F4823DRAFT_635558 [Ustulina deusta]|nr:hypothetical protein F4823DRAFT_635558 [Ustulina deusta]
MDDKVCFGPDFDINGQLEPRCATELGCSAFPSKPNPNGPDYDPDYWFGCSFSPSEPAFNRSMRADYNANTSLLTIVMSWSYDELSPQKPNFFYGFWARRDQ